MLSSHVYIEAHSRRTAPFASRMNLRDAAQGDCSSHLESRNSFTFNGFRTLLHNGRLQVLSLQSLPDSFHCNGGVYSPAAMFIKRLSPSLRYRNHSDTEDSAQSNVSSLIHGSRITGHTALCERNFAHQLRTFSQQLLSLPHFHFSWGGSSTILPNKAGRPFSRRSQLEHRIVRSEIAKSLDRRTRLDRKEGLDRRRKSFQIQLQQFRFLAVGDGMHVEVLAGSSLLERDFSRGFHVAHPMRAPARRDQVALAPDHDNPTTSRLMGVE
jgi:hypothetical protein